MKFTSLLFLPLYAVTALLYQRLESRARVLLLLAASWTFFLLESPGSGVILFFVTLVTYAAGLLLARSSGKMKTRRLLLTLVLVITLGLLGVFKYSGRFFLPAGISFYTFQALSYVMDVYRGDFPAERRFCRYALYLSFFPQVVAGPIERPKDLMGQLACKAPVTVGDFRVGGFLMLRGYAKKIMIADAIAPVSDALFADNTLTGPKVLAAAVLFGLQIYADFSGYSDIALGAARLLGIRLTENFKNPYLADGIRDFWRRWHITLSRWLREYVYIPLGGNRKGRLRTAANTLAVFALSGLWHGGGLHFLCWGLAHGVFVLLEDLTPKKAPGRSALREAATFLLVSLLWILFRAPSLGRALAMYAALLSGWGSALKTFAVWVSANRLTFVRLLPIVPLLILLRSEPSEGDTEPGMRVLWGGYALFAAVLIGLFMNLASGGAAPFIYFKF